jgi:pyrroloquinoline quinone biosynthesis protein E
VSEPQVAPSARPYTLIAELTYRCPLHCLYCSNPLDFAARHDGLETHDWLRVFRQAEGLGVLQLNLSGGEPLLRKDLEALVSGARELDLYVNLITSGVPLERERLVRLRDAGLSSVQLSIQDTNPAGSLAIAGRDAFEQKLEVARWVKELELPLTLNVVLHRQNLARTAELIGLGERLGAERLELANTQYLAWALENRAALLPSLAELDAARAVAFAEKARLRGKMDVLFVLPDYFSKTPKACMSGWGQRYILVNPEGLALPCHLALTLPGLSFDNVKARDLAEIWRDSEGFRAFRGEAWMGEPCRSCERRTEDFGGCRCQAFALTGDATRTDPACSLSPDHELIEVARKQAEAPLVELRVRPRATQSKRAD